MNPPGIQIVQAVSPEDLATAANLFRAYAEALGVDLCFQDFAAELADLPGKYAPPRGALLLARGADGQALGCVALRPAPHLAGGCEMKRMYVAPAARGLGLGRALAAAVIGAARQAGYQRMVLDTLPSLSAALALYADLGFVRIAAYYDTPIAETVFLQLTL